MEFREEDQMRWRGVRPAHNGTQWYVTATVNNGFNTIYTVPAGQIVFITHAWIGMTANANLIGYIDVQMTAAPAYCPLVRIYSIANTSFLSDHAVIWPPIEVPAGYIIRMYDSSVVNSVVGALWGWIE